MLLHYGFLWIVPPFLVYKLIPDQKEQTAALLENRPDVKRNKAHQAEIVKLIKDNSEQKEEVLNDLLKKGLTKKD